MNQSRRWVLFREQNVKYAAGPEIIGRQDLSGLFIGTTHY